MANFKMMPGYQSRHNPASPSTLLLNLLSTMRLYCSARQTQPKVFMQAIQGMHTQEDGGDFFYLGWRPLSDPWEIFIDLRSQGRSIRDLTSAIITSVLFCSFLLPSSLSFTHIHATSPPVSKMIIGRSASYIVFLTAVYSSFSNAQTVQKAGLQLPSNATAARDDAKQFFTDAFNNYSKSAFGHDDLARKLRNFAV
jgi:hypothetical protein